jgi:hypothetical protein
MRVEAHVRRVGLDPMERLGVARDERAKMEALRLQHRRHHRGIVARHRRRLDDLREGMLAEGPLDADANVRHDAVFMEGNVRWIGFAAGVASVLIVWLFWMPTHSSPAVSGEVTSYRLTVQRMQEGEGYYEAMSSSLLRPPSNVRSLRLPTIFVLWRFIGLSWPLTLVVIVVSGLLIARLADPIIGFLAVLWLALTAYSFVNEMWTEVEFWALPLVLGSILAIRRDRWTLAACLMLAAACIRELAAPCLLMGIFVAHRADRPVRPWALCLAAWVVYYALHMVMAAPWLDPTGSEFPLIGTGGLRGFLIMSGAGLGLIGPVVVGAGIWRSRLRSECWLVLPLVVGIPLAGFFVWRLYWPILCFPVAAALLMPSSRTRTIEPSTEATDVIVLPESDVIRTGPVDTEAGVHR